MEENRAVLSGASSGSGSKQIPNNMKITYDNVAQYILAEFPDYDSSSWGDEDKKLAYVVFGDFVLYAVDLFKKNGKDDPTVQKLFRFVNEQFAISDDEKLLELLTIEVFEQYAQEFGKPEVRSGDYKRKSTF